MLIQPLNNKSVRRQQLEYPSILDGLERTNPSIELLLRQLCLKVSNTSIPYCRFGLQGCPREGPKVTHELSFFCGEETGQSILEVKVLPDAQTRIKLRFLVNIRPFWDSSHNILFY